MSGRAAGAAVCLEMHFSDEFVSLGSVPSPCHVVSRLPPGVGSSSLLVTLYSSPHPRYLRDGNKDKKKGVVTWSPLLFPSHCPRHRPKLRAAHLTNPSSSHLWLPTSKGGAEHSGRLPWGSQGTLPYTSNRGRGKWQSGGSVMGKNVQRNTQSDSPTWDGMAWGEGWDSQPCPPPTRQPLKPEGDCAATWWTPKAWAAGAMPSILHRPGGAHYLRTSAEGTQVSPGLG